MSRSSQISRNFVPGLDRVHKVESPRKLPSGDELPRTAERLRRDYLRSIR